MGKRSLNIRVVPHTTKFLKSLGTIYLNQYYSIRNIRNRHKVAIIDIADANDITNKMSFSAGYNRMYTIPVLSDRNRKYNPYNRLSRFK